MFFIFGYLFSFIMLAGPIILVIRNIKLHFAFDELLDYEKKKLLIDECICNFIGIMLMILFDDMLGAIGNSSTAESLYLNLQFNSLTINVSYPVCPLPFGLIAYFYLKYAKTYKNELKNLAMLVLGITVLLETITFFIFSIILVFKNHDFGFFIYYSLVPFNFIITAGSELIKETKIYLLKIKQNSKEKINMNENVLEQNAVFTANITEKPQNEDIPKFKAILAAALTAAFLYTLCFKGENVLAGLSSVLFFNAVSIGGLCMLKLFDRFRRKGGMLLLLPIALLSTFNAYYEYSYYNIFNCIAFFVLFTCMMLYCAGIERHPALDSILDCIFNKMLKGSNETFFSSVNVNGIQFFKIGIGIAVSMPFLAVIGYLLMTGDDAFFDAMSAALNIDGWSVLWTIIVFIAIFMYACGFLYKFLYNEKRIVFNGIATDMTIAVSFLTSINLLFAFFCSSQLRYFFGNTPITEFTTYSRFAREGFFQLLLVTFINFSIILAFTDILKAKTKGALKLSLIMLCVFTLVLILSSFYRMYLYIDAYGYTPLRIEVITFLAAETVLIFTTLYAVFYNKTNITHTFIIAASAALISLNITARPEFSLSLNDSTPTDTAISYTHSELPLLINGYNTAHSYEIRNDLMKKIANIYDREKKAEHNWQSANFQSICIQKQTEKFLSENR